MSSSGGGNSAASGGSGGSSQLTATPTTSGSASGSGSSSHLSIPQTAPAGGLTITQPPQSSTSFFKIASGQPITFAWNFTSLYVQPAHLTISAACENGNTYPVGPTDGVIPGTATSVVWDVYSYNQEHQATPLAPLQYQLLIWDDKGPGKPQQPGVFAENEALKFGLYTPAPYTPLASGWQCMGCKSGALERATAHPAFAALIATMVVCLVSGWGLLRRHHN